MQPLAAVSHFNLAWCRCSCRSMAAATSELHRCPRRCRDPSLRITEQVRMGGILMGNSVICTSRSPDTLWLDCTQRSICENVSLRKTSERSQWEGREFGFVFFNYNSRFTCVGGKIHIHEPGKSSCVSEFPLPFSCSRCLFCRVPWATE